MSTSALIATVYLFIAQSAVLLKHFITDIWLKKYKKGPMVEQEIIHSNKYEY